MAWSVTLAGETFTDANVAGNAYADEATGFPAILAAFAREAAFLQGLAATSATPATPAPGPVTLVTHQDAGSVGLSPGMLVRVASAADPARLMVATVTAYAGTALDLEVIFAAGGAAADWVITRPAGGTSLALDPAPALAADLDAGGRSIAGLANLAMTGTLTVGGAADIQGPVTVRTGMQSGALFLGNVSGDVVIQATDPLHIYATITGDTTFLLAGGTLPGMGHDHLIHWTMGGAGGYAVAVKKNNRLLRSVDLRSTAEAGETRPWVDEGTSLTLNAAAGPDGRFNVTELIEDVASAPHMRNSGISGLSPNQVLTLQAIVKAGSVGSRNIQLYIRDADASSNAIAGAVNLATGEFLQPIASGNGVLSSVPTVTPLDNGYHLLTVIGQPNTSGTNLNVLVQMLDGTSGNYTGDGSSVYIAAIDVAPGSQPTGMIEVGASRDGVWQGEAIAFSSLAAGETGDLGISVEPDGRIVVQDHSVVSA